MCFILKLYPGWCVPPEINQRFSIRGQFYCQWSCTALVLSSFKSLATSLLFKFYSNIKPFHFVSCVVSSFHIMCWKGIIVNAPKEWMKTTFAWSRRQQGQHHSQRSFNYLKKKVNDWIPLIICWEAIQRYKPTPSIVCRCINIRL